jgi:DNA repair exonuclease SbcCD ATPase subunit
MYEIGLGIEENGNEYVLNKDFENRKIQMTGDGLEQEIANPSDVNQKLRDCIGFSSAAAFRSSACIEQDKISQITKGEKEIGDILQSTITGEDDATAKSVIEILNKALNNASNEIGRSTSYVDAIKKITKEIKHLEEECKHIQEEVNTTAKSNARILEIDKRLGEISSVLQTKINLKEKNDQKRACLAELKLIEEKIEHASNALKLNEEIETLDRRLTAYKPFFKLTDEDIETFHSLLGKKESLEELQNSLQEQLEHPKQKVIQKRPKLNQFFISGIVLLWIGLIGALLTKFMLILAFAGLVSLCIGIVFMISKPEVQIELTPAQIYKQINRASEQMNFIDENIKYFLSRTKCASTHEFIEKLESYKPLSKRKIEKESELLGMIGEETIEEIRQKFKDLALNRNKIKEKLEVLDPFTLDPEGYQRLLDEVDKLSQEKNQLENEKKELEIITANAKLTDEDLAVTQEKLASLRQKLELYEHRLKVYEECLECIEIARRKTLR